MKSLWRIFCLWLEVHTCYCQLSLLLRHVLSFLSVTKLSQPSPPTDLSCLGDLTPSWQAAAGLPYARLHRVSSRLQQPALGQSSGVSSTKCLPIPPTTWATVEHQHCVHVQHWFPTEYHSGSQELLLIMKLKLEISSKSARKSRMNIMIYTSRTK